MKLISFGIMSQYMNKNIKKQAYEGIEAFLKQQRVILNIAPTRKTFGK